MKRHLSAAILVAASVLSFPARGADVAVPVYKAPADLWTWSGFYIGANVGYSWGRSQTTMSVSTAANAFLFSGTNEFRMDDFAVGGQVGANWQLGLWVVGLEADLQASGERGLDNLACPPNVCTAGVGRVVSADLENRLTWFGTARARVGVTVVPTVLAYVTGGGVVGRMESLGTLTGVTARSAAVTSAFASEETKVGWTAGAGIEAALTPYWTAKLEYLYVDLGSTTASGGLPGNAPPITATFESRFRDSILRVGMNYKFGGPVVAKY